MRFLYARLLCPDPTRVIADGELSLACPAAICWGGGAAAGPFSCVPSVLLIWVLARSWPLRSGTSSLYFYADCDL